MDIETVHIIFKTHLDIGFTDFADAVAAQYFEQHIPQAMTLARTLRESDRPEQFVWTTGSWLIYEYLERADPQARRQMEAAIEAGDIVWHGLPFTTHSELMDADLFRSGLRLSQALDRRFGRKTISAKMTDVPGHSRAIVPLLAEAGITFLHIGVNGACTPPEVPPVFVWQDESGSDVVVMYHNNYGGLTTVPGVPDAFLLSHARNSEGEQDNLGPHTYQQVMKVFDEARTLFQHAKVRASTLDQYGQQLSAVKHQLPVVTEEIGDTWIHGVATDPKKVSHFRALARLRRHWLEDQRRSVDEDELSGFTRFLLMVPEHTWGLDEKSYLADYEHYARGAFDGVRKRPNFVQMERSWIEQRRYLDQAVQSLTDSALAEEATRYLAQLAPRRPATDGLQASAAGGNCFETTHFSIGFDPDCGAIAHLLCKRTGQYLAAANHQLARCRYQTFSASDYDRYLDQYLTSRPPWAPLDFSKPGLATAGAESRWWLPRLAQLYSQQYSWGHRFVLELAMPPEAISGYGSPRLLTLTLDLPDRRPWIEFDVQWFDKAANRMPEALWVSFSPPTDSSAKWMIDKLGRQISPRDVVRNGNRRLHAVDTGVWLVAPHYELFIETLDAPLVALGEPLLLNFSNKRPAAQEGVQFNLYNNVWGTNFPMWYGEDARFRFRLHTLPRTD